MATHSSCPRYYVKYSHEFVTHNSFLIRRSIYNVLHRNGKKFSPIGDTLCRNRSGTSYLQSSLKSSTKSFPLLACASHNACS